MRMHFFAMCRPDQSILGVAGLVGWLLARFLAHMCHVPCVVCACVYVCECAQQCIGESVLEPHLIYVVSHLSHLTWLVPRAGTQGPGAQHSFVCTPRCTCPYEYRMMDDVCACVCA